MPDFGDVVCTEARPQTLVSHANNTVTQIIDQIMTGTDASLHTCTEKPTGTRRQLDAP